MIDYREPLVTFVVLDFAKPQEVRWCLQSIKERVKFPHKVVYYHNGKTTYSEELFEMGLVDIFVKSVKNEGLGIGTRNAMALSFSPYTIYFQNDQIIWGKNFTQQELDENIALLDTVDSNGNKVKSVSLAGQTCGDGIFSERAHLIKTSFYRRMEHELPLGDGGAGPYHHQQWREGQIQKFYRDNNYIHVTSSPPLVLDIGKWTVRDCAGGLMRMRTDTKAVDWLIPATEEYIFPEHTSEEWKVVIAGSWPKGKIPQIYLDKGQSFSCWDNLPLA